MTDFISALFASEGSFRDTLERWRQEGLGEGHIFGRLMNNIEAAVVPGTRTIRDSPAKRFLISYLGRADQFSYPSIGFVSWGEERLFIYLHLLEEARSDLALEFALDQVLQYPRAAVPFFMTYRDGHYIPFILKDISRTESYSREVAESKVQAAIQLYEADRDMHAAVLEDAAMQYLRLDKEAGWSALEKIAGSSEAVKKVIDKMKDGGKGE